MDSFYLIQENNMHGKKHRRSHFLPNISESHDTVSNFNSGLVSCLIIDSFSILLKPILNGLILIISSTNAELFIIGVGLLPVWCHWHDTWCRSRIYLGKILLYRIAFGSWQMKNFLRFESLLFTLHGYYCQTSLKALLDSETLTYLSKSTAPSYVI